jgi:hypothetical protein
MKINIKKWFSLLEIILALILFSLLMTVIISLYNSIMKSKYNLSARQDLLQDTYLWFEKINSITKDYEIDYDDYSGDNKLISSTWIQELYLISQDETQKIFFRRKLINSGDRNGDWVISWDNEKQYNIQILKLKWFDAWNNHNFNIAISSWVYDWVIDTRACDYSQWFICTWTAISWWYIWFNLPKDQEDWWTNLFPDNITISNRNITISPTKNPNYYSSNEFKINPYFTISITSKLYWKIRQKKLNQNFNNFQLILQTTTNTK